MCSRIAEKLKKIDPAAFEGHVGFIRPELLDRRLSDGDHDAPRPDGWCAASRWPGDGRAARATQRHDDQHPGLPIAITSLVLPDGPGGRVGRLRTVTAMPMGRTAPPAPIGTVVRVRLRAPAGARPLVCRSRWSA